VPARSVALELAADPVTSDRHPQLLHCSCSVALG